MSERPPQPLSAGGSLSLAGWLGFVLAATQLPLSLSLGVVFDPQQIVVRSLLLLLFPVAYACLGVGAALAPGAGALARPATGLRLGGGALLGLQLAVLTLPLLTAEGWRLRGGMVVIGVLLSGWYFSLGLVLSRVLGDLRERRPERVGVFWAVHLVGIVVGYGASIGLVPAIGAHALLVAVGLSALPGGLWGVPVLVAVLGLAGPVDLDRHLEDARSGPVALSEVRSNCAPIDPADPVSWRGWSHHAYVQIVHVRLRDTAIAGYYNRRCMWSVAQQGPSELDRVRRALYRAIAPEGAVTLIGVGGGRGLQAFPVLSDRITAVEQDGAVVRVLRDLHPEWSGGRLTAVNTVAADGRSVVERGGEPLAGLIIEGAVFQPSQAMIPASRVSWLYTVEAVTGYLDALADDGLLLVNFNRVTATEASDGYLLGQVVTTLRELGAPFRALRSAKGHVYLAACARPGCLDRFAGAWSDLPVADVTERLAAADGAYRLRDDTPFVGWAVLAPPARQALAAVAVGVIGLALVPVWIRRHRHAGWDPAPAGVALGLAHGTVVLAVAHLLRSYSGDSVLTVLGVYLAFAACGGLGGVLAGWLPRLLRGRWGLLAGTALAGAALLLGLRALPFGPASVGAQALALVLALGPLATWTGMLLPLALGRTAPEAVGTLLLADALGTLAAAGVLYLVALPLGLTVWLGVGLAAYAVAAVLVGEPAG